MRSWLLVPIWFANKSVKFLGFDALQGEKKWSDDDIALVRTVGEIFANALERKRAEAQKEALEVQLRQAQRMEAIGTLAGGIAHDFNTVLSAILGYGELAIAALPEAAARGGTCKKVMTAGERARAIVNQILTFSRRDPHHPRPVLMQPVIEEATGSSAPPADDHCDPMSARSRGRGGIGRSDPAWSSNHESRHQRRSGHARERHPGHCPGCH